MSNGRNYSEITPDIKDLALLCKNRGKIEQELYTRFDVKRGLRDLSGEGVLTGLTHISEIRSSVTVNGKKRPCEGSLFYRGINVCDLVNGFLADKRFGFEEAAYLLLFGGLPSADELSRFSSILAGYRSLPTSFVRDIILKAPSRDMMNTLARSVLTMYSYDTNSDDISPENVLRQCLQLIAVFPLLSVYGYHAYRHYHDGQSLFIHSPSPALSTAENILSLLRPDCTYTELETKVLDLALVLHAEHGGGNNSSFTIHVVTSSGTDTYSAVAAALGSLKGPRHGGANIKVIRMFDDLKANVRDLKDDDEINAYLHKLLNKEAFDRQGLIYGFGHAVYSLSDPRAVMFRSFVSSLAAEKGRSDEFELYARVERLAPALIASERRMYKGVSANVDFYSGFAYGMLGLPPELFTPIFAVARIAGWSAHRLEEIVNNGKIIRPSYKSVSAERAYIPLGERR